MTATLRRFAIEENSVDKSGSGKKEMTLLFLEIQGSWRFSSEVGDSEKREYLGKMRKTIIFYRKQSLTIAWLKWRSLLLMNLQLKTRGVISSRASWSKNIYLSAWCMYRLWKIGKALLALLLEAEKAQKTEQKASKGKQAYLLTLFFLVIVFPHKRTKLW